MTQKVPGQAGMVYMVGAGPGDPELVTVRGMECLCRADVVVYDALAPSELVALVAGNAERVPVGKRHGKRSMTQEQINELLIDRARAGKLVVRLKGGDPFVFGRGGEEVAALRAAGVPYEIVPGVTAGVAAPAYAGIPITHRDYASAVAFITGHEDPSKSFSSIDWPALARFPGTLVFYMGITHLESLATALLQHDMAAETPAAVVERGTTPAQRTVAGRLDEIARRAQAAGLRPPAVIVIGPVAGLADRLGWFEGRPLLGQSIAVTRPVQQAQPLVDQLTQLGASVLELPAIRVEPPESWERVDKALCELGRYDWIVFTSANGVSYFLDHLLAGEHDLRSLGQVRIAAIGSATAQRLQQYHLRPDLVPDEAHSERLVEVMRRHAKGQRLLLLRADRGREALPEGLRKAGIEFDEVAVYRSVDQTEFCPDVIDRLARGEVDWVTVTSSAIVRSLWVNLPTRAKTQLGRQAKLASLSPVTSATAQELGLPVAVEAARPSVESLVEAIVRWVQREQRAGGDSLS